tara:strand:- start:1422 stop:1859 length:438 start_codon:yes stop_codon:yes gene_type:complete
MAETKAMVDISSTDLQPGNTLSISASSTLMQAGLTTGLTQVESGVISLAQGVESRLGPLATEVSGDAHDIGSYLYISNTATDATFYVEWGIHETVIGRLYAGDWMFIPWSASDDGAELELEAENGAQVIEYAWFNNDFILTAAAS